MIDGFRRPPRRSSALHPEVKRMMGNAVIGDHSKSSKPHSAHKPHQFTPPGEVAAYEERTGENNTAGKLLGGGAASGQPPGGDSSHMLPAHAGPDGPKKRRSLRSLIAWIKSLGTRQKIMLTAAAALVLSGAIIGTYFAFFHQTPPPEPVRKQQPAEEPKPKTVASNLTGLQVKPSVNKRPVIAVMIENSVVARPQSGLLDAGVVFEAIAEGGITRFVALYQDTSPEYVGPVRSARPYYMQWLLGFDASYAHAGGSAEALSLIGPWGVRDLNHHASYFWRIPERAPPHNLYTSIPKLREYNNQKGYGESEFTPLARKEKPTPAKKPTAAKIDFDISSANFNVHYDYHAKTNTYRRSIGGTPHTDEKTGKQIAPKTVVALIMPQGRSGIYYTYQTVGSGQAVVFQDGKVIKGTWKKSNREANLEFTDSKGQEIKLNPGQTWFTALGEANRVKYTK